MEEKMKKMAVTCGTVFVLALLWLSACGQNPPVQPPPAETKQAESVSLTVAAAASLKDAMTEASTVYKEEEPNVTITYTFGSSGTLQQQIEQGAPVDVFISAANKQIDALESKALVEAGTKTNLVGNEVVAVAPVNATTTIEDFRDLGSDKVQQIGVGAPESVPAGEYAKQVLSSLGLWDQLQPKLVFAKDVRQVLTYVETGNVDVGIVYGTDAKISDKVKVVARSPVGSHTPVIYPAVVIKGSKNPEAAKEFVQFLAQSDRAATVFAKYGFTKITPGPSSTVPPNARP